MTNYKTTLSGVGAVLGGLALAIHAFLSNPIDGGQLTAAITAITGGIGLIFAKDAASK